MPIVIQVYLNAGIAYGLNRALGVPHNVACPSALIGASNFFELAVAAAIALFGFQSGAALATVVGVLVEVPVMLSVVRIVLRTPRLVRARSYRLETGRDRWPMHRLRTRAATLADAAAIAAIYNEGIADRIATFETEPRSAPDNRRVVHRAAAGDRRRNRRRRGLSPLRRRFPTARGPATPASANSRSMCARDYRGRGAGRAVLAALIEAADAAGLHKLTSRVFPENAASRALLKELGFAEIGVHRRHGNWMASGATA